MVALFFLDNHHWLDRHLIILNMGTKYNNKKKFQITQNSLCNWLWWWSVFWWSTTCDQFFFGLNSVVSTPVPHTHTHTHNIKQIHAISFHSIDMVIILLPTQLYKSNCCCCFFGCLYGRRSMINSGSINYLLFKSK